MALLDFEKGLVTAIAQNAETGEVLMVAFMNEEAFNKTLETGQAHYYSRSRDKLWLKGETSGNVQEVKEILVDCDQDAVVLKIGQKGGACHKGYRSCFYRKVENGELTEIAEQLFDPDEVYGDT
jgi:phosphoribosyl-AMP cyclohydrolase